MSARNKRFTERPEYEIHDDGWIIPIEKVYILGHVTQWLKERQPINRVIRGKPRPVYRCISDVCAAYPDIFTHHTKLEHCFPAAILPDGSHLFQYRPRRKITLLATDAEICGQYDDDDFLLFTDVIGKGVLAEYGNCITDNQVKELVAPFLHFGPGEASR